MQNKFEIEIYTPESVILQDKADMVIIPGQNGELGILPKHTPLLTFLKKGRLKIKNNTQTLYFSIDSGFAEILPNKVVILTEKAEKIKN
ncbi:MAG: ATP synthase F1 subunit epsilon [Candidatus Firestonebacteria bacterium]